MLSSLLTFGTFLAVSTTAYANTQILSTSSTTTSDAISPLNLYAPQISLANCESYKVIGSGVSGGTINVTISDNRGNSVKETTTVGSNGVWNFTDVDVSRLSDGPITVLAKQTTPNGGEASKTFSTSKNTTTPVAPTVSKKLETIKKSNDSEYTVSGKGTVGYTVIITLTDSNGKTIQGETVVGANGSWVDPVIDTSPLSRGHIYVDAVQKNTFGNTSPKSVMMRTTKTTKAQLGISNVPLHLMTSGKTSAKPATSPQNSTSVTSNGTVGFPSGWTGIFVLNNPNAVIYGVVGHEAAGILLPNGEVYFESFGPTNWWPWNHPGQFYPADWYLTTHMTGRNYLFPSLQDFREWLVETSVFNDPSSDFDNNSIVFIGRTSTQTSDMESRANYWRYHIPTYNLGGEWDCQSLTDNVMQAGSVHTSYFSAVNPNAEQDNLDNIAKYGYANILTQSPDPQGYDFYMWNPNNNTLWWIS